MKKAPPAVALAALAALGTSLLVSTTTPVPAHAADAPEILSVDFAQPTGAFRGGATGTLYGFGDDGAPTQALVNGAHITNTSQKAPFGTQHPSGDALSIEDGFFAKHGQDLYIYTQDYYPDWAYHGGVRPGDTRTYDLTTGTYTEQPNGVWDYLEVVEFVTEAVATSSSHPEDYVHIPFNEPDAGNWYHDWGTIKQVFLDDWEAAYDTIQEVYARHGLGPARVGGPGDAGYQPQRTADFLDAAQASGTLPQVMIWHELGIDNLATFRSHLRHYRDLEEARGIADIPVNITEYGMLRDMGTPGQLIQWLAMFEDTKVDAQTAYWNYAGNLSDNSARTNGANAGWWMFSWYGDLAGSETVSVTPPQLDVADTLQGIAALDRESSRATVLYGGGHGGSVTLDLDGLDPEVFGERVDVEVREATLSGAEGLHGTPRVVLALDGAALDSGSLDLTVPTYDRYAGYQVVVTPAQTRAVEVSPVWQASIEAEDARVSSATVYTQDPTDGGGWKFLASGGKDVGSFNNPSARLDWDVTVPRTGTYRFQVVGATPGTPGRHALFVDGAHATTVQYTADLALTNPQRWQYRGSAEVTVDLTEGDHVLSLRASEDGTSVLPKSDITLDKLLLTDVTDGEPTVYPASTMRLAGGAAVRYDQPGARGLASIGPDQRADVYATAWESGYHDVAVDWQTPGAARLDMSVNGRSVAVLDSPGAGRWISTARLHLSEGINEIELRSADGVLVSTLTTTRASAADSAAVTVEAEDAVRLGGATVVTTAPSSGSNASGGKYVGSIGSAAANAVEIPRQEGFDTPGLYDVVVTYANAETQGAHAYNPQVVDRRLDITEEGATAPAGSAYFRYTYSWDSFWDRTVPVVLTTGSAPLVLGNGDGWAPNVDKVTVAQVLLGTPTTVAGPAALPQQPTVDLSPGEPDGADAWYVAPVELTARAVDAAAGHTVQTQVDDGQWEETTGPLVVGTDGRHTVSVRTRDSAWDASEPVVIEVAVDQTAPVTVAVPTTTSGSALAAGAEPLSEAADSSGAMVSSGTAVSQRATASARAEASGPVTVTFSATDETSGVASTETSVDGGLWTATGPEGLTLTAPGTVDVAFRSTDTAGNVEAVQSVTATVASPTTPTTEPGATTAPGSDGPGTAAPGSDGPGAAPTGAGGAGTAPQGTDRPLASTGATAALTAGVSLAFLLAGATAVSTVRRRSAARVR